MYLKSERHFEKNSSLDSFVSHLTIKTNIIVYGRTGSMAVIIACLI